MRALAGHILLAAAVIPLGVAAAQDHAPAPSATEAARLEAESAKQRAMSEELAAEAAALTADISQLRGRLVTLGEERQKLERGAADAEARLEALSADERIARERLNSDRTGLTHLLGARLRLERTRPPAIAVVTGDVVDAARAAHIVARLEPHLDQRMQRTEADLLALADVRARLGREHATLVEAQTTVAANRSDMESLIEQKAAVEKTLRGDAESAAEEADALAARARSIRELITSLEARNIAPPTPAPRPPESGPTPRLKPARSAAPDMFVSPMPDTRRFADARGLLSPPALGPIVARFGERGSAGDGSGVVIRTRPAAQVASPFAARVEYAGRFRGYGQLLILNAGDGYHMVVAGLSKTYGATGQSVLAGEPIGEMPQSEEPPPDLYFEVRKDGNPMDPAPWLRG